MQNKKLFIDYAIVRSRNRNQEQVGYSGKQGHGGGCFNRRVSLGRGRGQDSSQERGHGKFQKNSDLYKQYDE